MGCQNFWSYDSKTFLGRVANFWGDSKTFLGDGVEKSEGVVGIFCLEEGY